MKFLEMQVVELVSLCQQLKWTSLPVIEYCQLMRDGILCIANAGDVAALATVLRVFERSVANALKPKPVLIPALSPTADSSDAPTDRLTFTVARVRLLPIPTAEGHHIDASVHSVCCMWRFGFLIPLHQLSCSCRRWKCLSGLVWSRSGVEATTPPLVLVSTPSYRADGIDWLL